MIAIYLSFYEMLGNISFTMNIG